MIIAQVTGEHGHLAGHVYTVHAVSLVAIVPPEPGMAMTK